MDTFEKIVHWIKIAVAIGFFFLIFKAFTDWIPNNGWNYKYHQSRTSQIFSLRTTSEIEGSFILCIGSIGEQDYYVFYRKTLSGGLIREKLLTSHCVLYEGHPVPKIIESGKMGYHLSDGDTIGTQFHRDDYGWHSIYIPKGTITERINIDIN